MGPGVKQHGPGCLGVINGGLAGQDIVNVITDRQNLLGARQNLRLVLLVPKQLASGVHLTDREVCDVVQLIRRDGACKGVLSRRETPIQVGNAVSNRRIVFIQDHHGLSNAASCNTGDVLGKGVQLQNTLFYLLKQRSGIQLQPPHLW